jgi:hypothetical protein
VNETKSQHVLGVAILKVLGLDFIRIKLEADGSYSFKAWSVPPVKHNGSSKVIRRGTVAVK